MDAGYDVIRLAWLLADLPVVVCARLRSDRVFCRPPPPSRPACPATPPARHPVALRRPGRPGPAAALASDGRAGRHGTVAVAAWDQMHPKLCTDSAWEDHPGKVPIIEGTLIQLRPAPLPGHRELAPMWLWASSPAPPSSEITTLWQAYLRRFDLEHTFLLQGSVGLLCDVA